jgi:GR25 family glycosyltransferase involved in LPS biosynthesis
MSETLETYVRAHQKQKERILKSRSKFIERGQPIPRHLGKLRSHKPLNTAEEQFVVENWPSEMRQIFIISIRPKRLNACFRRLKGLSKYVTIIPSCNGEDIDKHQWLLEGTIRPRSKLSRGKMGCFESHCRMWRFIVEHNFPQALILEDDVRLHPSAMMLSKLLRGLAEIKSGEIEWDLLFFGRSHKLRNNHERLTTNLVVSADFWGLFAYVVKRDCAIKLLQHACVTTFVDPVDVVLSRLGERGVLKIIAFDPEVCNQVPAPSDTNMII